MNSERISKISRMNFLSSRRRFVCTQFLVGVSIFACPVILVQAKPDSVSDAENRLSKFFQVSRKLLSPLPLDTHLDRRVATRLLAALNSEYPSFSQQMDLMPEDPGPGERQSPLARLIARAWYTGVVGRQLVTFERALMYRLTADALPVPSYCTGRPGDWSGAPQLKFGRV